ncbi:sigma-70 family RNA polymerase sigma factor [Lysinibacillus sp. FSL M8-0216]|uniref:RNA polymerase sigma factor n=1 Tax=Lysinibacillus TaxID=400634 RepID=UPI0000F37BC6|nr:MULTISPECIES: sigma-70 family RNA polymerase sigma factor [Lysinibacillus]EAZ85281.1 RNA polymerase sigma factor Y [Bacillus sp. B14905]HAU34543.1 RNA polymerase subunit sigma [Lysinibacillus sp.]MCG7437730.1 sigma-70 family RNA polymerase sigma factor [Lysinibacillus fusiformis]MED4075188.1 sigma-70 family RNA polymerase sigma factor [Lysinibacillus fusiformis]MED4669113.1 sigma-70 family RNA polymerase sigma factor [Lysinibacillus fusiformis]
MEEAELIVRAQQGDKEAYIDLIRIHQQTVEKFAFQCGVHSNDLADVSQEVFVKLYRFLHQFKQDRFTTWLYKITLNATRDYYRKEQRELAKEDKLNAQRQTIFLSAEDDVLLFEEDKLLHNAIQALDEKYRYPIVLYYFHELKYEEIAEVLNISLSTVKVRLLRAKEKLKAALMQEGSVENG